MAHVGRECHSFRQTFWAMGFEFHTWIWAAITGLVTETGNGSQSAFNPWEDIPDLVYGARNLFGTGVG